jgi:hypothetical protein
MSMEEHETRVDVGERYRPPTAPVPATDTAPLLAPNDAWSEHSDPATITVETVEAWSEHGRRMQSPEVHAIDYGASGTVEALTGYPVRIARASGAAREIALGDHAARMGGHASRVTRSRKGRASFVITRHGRSRAPFTGESSGLAGLDAIGLAAIADGILRASDGERVVSPQGRITYGVEDIAGIGRTRPMLGTTVRAFAQVTPSLILTGSRKSNDKEHRRTLREGCGITGDAFGVARHTADLAGWLNGVRRTYLSGERRDHEGSRLAWTLRTRVHGRLRASERGSWSRVGETAQYVAADDPTQCLAWSADGERYWRGHALIARGALADRKAPHGVTAPPSSPADAATMDRMRALIAHDWSTGAWSVTLPDGWTLTVRRTSDRYACSLTVPADAPDASPVIVRSWRARTPVSAVRVP